MKCEKCGADIDADAKFCPGCGRNIISHKERLQLKCNSCGGTMTVDGDRRVLSCPFCGSKELIQESDEVVIQRIKSQTYKDVEMEKIKYENAKEQRKLEKEQKEAVDKQYKKFLKGKLSKVLIVALLACVLATYVSFSYGRILSGAIAIVQIGVFATSWLMGMQFIKEKIPRLHVLLAAIGFLLIIVFMKANSFRIVSDRVAIPTITADATTNKEEGIYTYQIRNYVGKNLETVSTVNRDYYGEGYIDFVYVTKDGMIIDPRDSEQKKEYVVGAQSIQPGTNLVIVHSRDRHGKPEMQSVAYQNYEEIILYVNKVEEEKYEPSKIQILEPTLDRHKYYVRDYVGRNAASLGGYSTDKYGRGYIDLVFMSESGEYIDSRDRNILKQYIVVRQDPAVNTEIVFEYKTDKYGIESVYSIENQNYEEITLTVRKLDDKLIKKMPDFK